MRGLGGVGCGWKRFGVWGVGGEGWNLGVADFGGLAAEEPHEECEEKADEDAGDDGEMEAEVAFGVVEVARELAEPAASKAGPEEEADEDEGCAEKDEEFSHFRHIGSIYQRGLGREELCWGELGAEDDLLWGSGSFVAPGCFFEEPPLPGPPLRWGGGEGERARMIIGGCGRFRCGGRGRFQPSLTRRECQL